MGLKFREVYTFFNHIGMNDDDRILQDINIRYDLIKAKKYFELKMLLLEGENKYLYVSQTHKLALQIIDSLSIKQVEEKLMLNEFIELISSYFLEEPLLNVSNYRKIFKDRRGFDFFVKAIQSLNIVDENFVPKQKFQTIAKAIFDDKDFKSKIFTYDLSMKDYVAYLNAEFKLNINPNSMSKGCLHEEKVSEFINDNFY